MGTVTEVETSVSKKDWLIANLDYATDEQIDFIMDLLNLGSYPNKWDLFKLAGKNDTYRRKVDSATPIDYHRKIAELYPNFVNGNMVYDYNEKSFGEMLNINDLIVSRILKLKK